MNYLMEPDHVAGLVLLAASPVWLLAACCIHVKRTP